MLPFPRIKLICGILSDKNDKNFLQSSLEDRNKLMIHEFPYDSRIFNLNINVKDSFMSDLEINNIINLWTSNSQNKFIEWLPNSLHINLR